ncbi:SCO family protein [Parahaliea mediterranea]|uniref:SCO family protein n=1 Tax=Parahaliea mediterranea TaxID=651086 RepID=UPI0013004150|nr:SCO family protein [Parahaliea mediterranea]
MSLSPKARMLAGIAIANLVLLGAAAWAYLQRPPTPPQIQGALLQQPRALDDFRLIDQHGKAFSRSDLLGQWHLVSYGFTTCPDICPTTLNQLVAFDTLLAQDGAVPAPQVLFYSIDHRRDTPQQLSAYLPYFDQRFIGLTHRDDPANPHLPFEQGLGLVARLEPIGNDDAAIARNDYRVSHGVALYLLNPQGELQAVFQPDQAGSALPGFSPQTLAADYRAVRRYLASLD